MSFLNHFLIVYSGTLLVLSVDPVKSDKRTVEDFVNIIRSVESFIEGVKIGLPFLLKYGSESLSSLRRFFGKMIIADLKLADIGDIMFESTEYLAEKGVDAIIAHSFTGRKGAIEDLAEKLKEIGVKLILVVSMSHSGSTEYVDKHVDEFAKMAVEIGAFGVVAPATRPEIVSRVRSLVGSGVKIFSPGIGAQGGTPGEAICHGADYEIVGRRIIYSQNPVAEAVNVKKIQAEVVSRCRSS